MNSTTKLISKSVQYEMRKIRPCAIKKKGSHYYIYPGSFCRGDCENIRHRSNFSPLDFIIVKRLLRSCGGRGRIILWFPSTCTYHHMWNHFADMAICSWYNTMVCSTNITDHYDITEILLNVANDTYYSNPDPFYWHTSKNLML